jgi:hypothetical protein
MSYCPIYNGECPEDSMECTFWHEKTIPAQRTKMCDSCKGAISIWDCDDCSGIIHERIIKECVLKRKIMPEIVNGEKESFVVSIERFTRDGEKFATISLSEVTDSDSLPLVTNLQLKHSYCDIEEIIDKAYYQAMREVDNKISNAGFRVD